MIGTGYVGLVSGTCFADLGNKVFCLDKDVQKIKKLNSGQTPIYEPGLSELIKKNFNAGRLVFTTDLARAVNSSDLIFICVGTPTKKNSQMVNLNYVFQAIKDIAKSTNKKKIIITKSTVPVGTGDEIEKILKKLKKNNFEIVSNPEFLREGEAIRDFRYPDRIVIGSNNKQTLKVTRNLYSPLINKGDISLGMGSDLRIGSRFLRPGPAYGGSCFPKDTKGLVSTGDKFKVNLSVVKSVIKSNKNRVLLHTKRIDEIIGKNFKDKKIVFLGVTFKPNTDDMRDSTSLSMIPYVAKKGAKVFYYDPTGVKKEFNKIKNCKYINNVNEACKKADLIILHTDWDEFKTLDFRKIVKNSKFALYDLRNLYNPNEMIKKKIKYFSIGR